MAELLGSTRAVALSASWTGAGSLKVYHSKIVLYVCFVCVHTNQRLIVSCRVNKFRVYFAK